MIGRMSPARRAVRGHRLPAYAQLPSRPWFLAAPLRISADPRADVLTLHTVQSRAAYETLASEGVLVGDPSLGWAEFREAYDWMRRQMARRLPEPRDGILWLWPTATRKDIRRDARQARGEVLLTVRVARERVLLSHFSDWHIVLNRGLHVPQLPGETDEEWDARYTKMRDAFDARTAGYRSAPLSEWPDDTKIDVETSWEAIFDPATWRQKPPLQATMHELFPGDVVRAVRIR